MKLETFFEKFDQFADAPDAAAKMRELVLQLAMQGKLSNKIPMRAMLGHCSKRLRLLAKQMVVERRVTISAQRKWRT